MRPLSSLVTWICALAAALLLDPAGAAPPSYWQEGAAGYARARAEARESGRPLLVYFYADWCPYCRELQSGLFASGAVETYLRSMARVRISPENGEAEARLAREYGVDGYPALFVLPGGQGPPQRIVRSTLQSGRVRLKTPEEFIATLRQAAER